MITAKLDICIKSAKRRSGSRTGATSVQLREPERRSKQEVKIESDRKPGEHSRSEGSPDSLRCDLRCDSAID